MIHVPGRKAVENALRLAAQVEADQQEIPVADPDFAAERRSGAAPALRIAAWTVNYRSLNLQLFEDVDRYTADLHDEVQDGYIERRKKCLAENTF